MPQLALLSSSTRRRERESFVSRLSPHKLRLAAVLWRLPLVVFYMRAAAVYSCCSTAHRSCMALTGERETLGARHPRFPLLLYLSLALCSAAAVHREARRGDKEMKALSPCTSQRPGTEAEALCPHASWSALPASASLPSKRPAFSSYLAYSSSSTVQYHPGSFSISVNPIGPLSDDPGRSRSIRTLLLLSLFCIHSV